MDKSTQKTARRTARHARIRARVSGTAERPRLAIFKSNRFVYAQLINDDTHTTIAAVDTRSLKGETPTERAEVLGSTIAELAKKQNLAKVVFDRGGYKYQGIIATVADSARKAGLEF